MKKGQRNIEREKGKSRTRDKGKKYDKRDKK